MMLLSWTVFPLFDKLGLRSSDRVNKRARLVKSTMPNMLLGTYIGILLPVLIGMHFGHIFNGLFDFKQFDTLAALKGNFLRGPVPFALHTKIGVVILSLLLMQRYDLLPSSDVLRAWGRVSYSGIIIGITAVLMPIAIPWLSRMLKSRLILSLVVMSFGSLYLYWGIIFGGTFWKYIKARRSDSRILNEIGMPSSQCSREQIAAVWNRLGTGTGRLAYLKSLQKARTHAIGVWPSELPNNANDAASTMLAQLEESWLGFVR